MNRSKLRNLSVVAAALLIAAFSTLSNDRAQAQASATTRQVPVFEVDPAWPKLPNNWVVGHVASVAVDRRDHVWMLHRRWPIGTNQAALAVGAIWATLTLAFEFGFGHWVVGQSWGELLEAYNLADGRVWVLVPIWTMIAPATMRALQQPQRS